ncbi:conserved oligomeric Golgi complex subunit 6-like [Ornithodoros turicata]|uniref:conserved oligomeric Golgi complex subunit 6-like n=1 Tax=Ornithodoros turicata TaxID=34597 RepID=UPI0031390986
MALAKETETENMEKLHQDNPLTRKLNKLLEVRLENDETTLDALSSLSEFFLENNIRTRRNLRGDIEKRSLAINEEFLQSFRDVKESLDGLCDDINAMNSCCKDMMDKLNTTKSQTNDLISQTTKLKAEGQRLQQRYEVSQAFLDTFQLKPEELKVLRGGRDGSLDDNFFLVLARIKKIHSDCKVLLRSSQATAGLEIMETMALHQEAAYERLYRWIQNECRLLTGEASDCNPRLCEGFASLEDRPILFKYSLDECSNARRASVVRNFIDALTRGGPGGNPRPIEVYSRDALRYVGDMLAWVHQCTASEKEMLENLLKKCDKANLEEAVRMALSHITEGLCRPLKVRIEQVIVSEAGAVTLYKLKSLLQFYKQTIQGYCTLSSDCPLLLCLDDMMTLSQKMFDNSLTCHCSQMLEKAELPPSDLGPPEALQSMLTLIRDLLSCQDACLVSVDDRRHDVPSVLDLTVDPALQMCHLSASKLSPADMAVYLANCVHLVYTTITLFEFTEPKLEMLQAQMDAHLDTLVSEQSSFLISNLGMSTLYRVLQENHPGALSTLPGCDTIAVRSVGAKLQDFVESPDSFTIPQAMLLISSVHRQQLRKRVLEVLCAIYDTLYGAVNEEKNGYAEPAMLLPLSPSEVQSRLL